MKTKVTIAAAVFAAMMGISQIGLSQAGAAAAKTTKPAVSKSADAADSKVETVKVTDPTKISKLNHTSVPPLVVEAEKRYLYAMSGGSGELETFQQSGKEYRYLSSDIGTRAKLLNYLTQIYTKQAAEYFIGKHFIEHDGRMAQLNADGGNALNFSKATAKMTNMTATMRVYTLYVPYEDAKQGREKITIKFEQVGDYWRVGTAPHAIF
ncbi:IseA DL-endopeptidase inhibitor family protein [Paenibacillus sp. CAA11]|uniref:IseA DL-endopeptidase inhibitor family protein n=1 Tax=Paenibacillus sp. CAA11 TaxID=1532905 RepID=UPI001F32650F|nr:IseA DL-endopeptidase inhibitor family protein [Paenibacillus sp. CAA11]